MHSSTVGFGVTDIEKTHFTWALLNWKVEIKSYPILNDTITVKTWPRIFDKLYSYRDFEVYDNQTLVAKASSKWVLFDIEKGKIVRYA